MRVATIVGNRPQFVKAAAVSRPLRARHEELLIHTGQHHDDDLSAVFFEELGVPAPDHWLGIAGGSNAEQLGRMLEALGPLLGELTPDAVLVYGDTNSTLAGAIAAADRGTQLVHVEAGMRSFDRTMPEERNRVLTDQLATLLLCSTASAIEHLRAEGTPGEAVLVGDVMVDVAHTTRERVLARADVLDRLGLSARDYVLATAHRAANVDRLDALGALVELLEAIPDPVVLPLHPRTRARLQDAGLIDRAESAAQITPPLGYLEFAALLHHAKAVLTDSGGVQKEAYLAQVPCITLRERTEWTETVDAGWNTLVGLDPAAALAALAKPKPAAHPELYGDGRAAERVVAAISALG
jgi:UDP-GlcNAc3NAcA epimerase